MKGKIFYAITATLALALLSTVAVAQRSNEVEITYVNSKGKIVGGKTYYCGGGISQWGTVTGTHYSDSTPCF
ncbi:MAG: DUF6289 family protein [Luteimonas sp.]